MRKTMVLAAALLATAACATDDLTNADLGALVTTFVADEAHPAP